MPTLLLYEAPFCHGADLTARWLAENGGRSVDSETVVRIASGLGGVPPSRLARTLAGSVSVFNSFTHERERAVAALRVAVSGLLDDDGLVLAGPAGLLVPRSVGFALRVCLVAPRSYRASRAAEETGRSRRDAERLVLRLDRQQLAWARTVADRGPWDAELHDLVLPMHATSPEAALQAVREAATRPALVRDAHAEAALADFQLAARINRRLAEAGHDVDVACENGYATIVLNRSALRLERLEEELKRLATSLPGVRDAITRVGPRFRQGRFDLELDAAAPAKVLLVDDEREYVQTLSERLRSRSIAAAVATSGEEALAMIEDDEPQVVVLDLQMPGIDGIEVLRRLRRGHPDTQVIILTGHGSDHEEAVAAELGAFAYLRKPVDISVLSRTMKAAYAALAGHGAGVPDGE